MRKTRGMPVLTCAFLATGALANDAVDSKINPQNSYIETVKSELGTSSYDVRLELAQGLEEEPTVLDVSTHSNDDRSPRIEIDPSGNAWITWWRDLGTDAVRVRKFSHGSQTFGTDRLVSQSSENARNPEVIFDGVSPWIVYEVHGTQKSVIVCPISDDPEPITTGANVGTTSYSGNLDSRIHVDDGHLWVTWIDSGTYVGWSEYDYDQEVWSEAAYESYSGSTVGSARQTIRGIVTGN